MRLNTVFLTVFCCFSLHLPSQAQVSIPSPGVINTIVGAGVVNTSETTTNPGYADEGTLAIAAHLNYPSSAAVDNQGNTTLEILTLTGY